MGMTITEILEDPIFAKQSPEYRLGIFEARLRYAADYMLVAINTSDEKQLTLSVKEFRQILQTKEGMTAYLRLKLTGQFDGYYFLPYVLGSSE